MENVTSFNLPSRQSRALYQRRSKFAAAGESEDETIVLSSHFVLERGKKEMIQKWVEAFTGLLGLICPSVRHLLMLLIVRCPQSVSQSLCYR